MLLLRHKDERGKTDIEWLKSRHSFSFGRYIDRNHMAYSDLHVINEDFIAPNGGFATHPHDNMEIITYVIKGQLAHKDSMGNGSIIHENEIQVMSAGSGITHSEYNASDTEDVHLLQIWVTPNVLNEAPSYQQKAFPKNAFNNQFKTVISPKSTDGALTIKQDAKIMLGHFDAGQETSLDLNTDRKYWAQIATGDVIINDQKLFAGDGLAIENESHILLQSLTPSQILLFDLRP